MEQRIGLSKGAYAGLFMVALATLTYEILLTRIFSVTMWYHFAFVAVSVAMFGMTAGALAVFLFPRFFTAERAHTHMAASGLLFAISIVASFMTHLSIPFVMPKTVVGLYSMALTYIDISIPFIFSGICVCLALTRFPERTNALYAFDLAGAATGCLVVVLVLGVFDGPSAVFLTAGLASLGSACFAGGAGLRRMRSAAILCFVLLAGVASANAYLASQQAAPPSHPVGQGGSGEGLVVREVELFLTNPCMGEPRRAQAAVGNQSPMPDGAPCTEPHACD